MADENKNDGVELRYARAAISSARAGLIHIREQKAGSWLALFFGYGLLANVRAIWDTLDKREATESTAHAEAIKEWKQRYSKSDDRNYQLLRVARNSLLKDLKSVPIASWHWGSEQQEKSYELAIYIPNTPDAESLLTERERKERKIVGDLMRSDDGDPSSINENIRIDLLHEAEVALNIWEEEVKQIEARIAEIRASYN